MSDILQQVDVHVHCVQCDESYDVSAALIAEAQRMLAQGCPGTPHECMPSFLASLVDASALESLTRAWRELERNARARSEALLMREHAALRRDFRADPMTKELARWEDDGGAPTRPAP